MIDDALEVDPVARSNKDNKGDSGGIVRWISSGPCARSRRGWKLETVITWFGITLLHR